MEGWRYNHGQKVWCFSTVHDGGLLPTPLCNATIQRLLLFEMAESACLPFCMSTTVILNIVPVHVVEHSSFLSPKFLDPNCRLLLQVWIKPFWAPRSSVWYVEHQLHSTLDWLVFPENLNNNYNNLIYICVCDAVSECDHMHRASWEVCLNALGIEPATYGLLVQWSIPNELLYEVKSVRVGDTGPFLAR